MIEYIALYRASHSTRGVKSSSIDGIKLLTQRSNTTIRDCTVKSFYGVDGGYIAMYMACLNSCYAASIQGY